MKHRYVYFFGILFFSIMKTVGGALGYEIEEKAAKPTVSEKQQPPSPSFLKRLTSYFSTIQPEKVQQKSPTLLVHEKVASLKETLKGLTQEVQKIVKIDQAIHHAKNEIQKNQLKTTSQALKKQITTQKIPAFIDEFTQFYITLEPHFRMRKDFQEFAKTTLEHINNVGKQLEGKYWQSYALLTEQELKRAQYREILDRIFNKNFNELVNNAQNMYRNASSSLGTGYNFFAVAKGHAYTSIMKALNDLASLDPAELSNESHLGILYFQAYLSSLMAGALVSVFNNLPVQAQEVASMSPTDKEDFLHDLKIDLKKTIKNSVKFQDALDDTLRQDLKKAVESLRENNKRGIPSLYATLEARNRNASMQDGQLEKYSGEFDTALNNALRSINNPEHLKKNREKIVEVLNAFLATAKVADPSQIELMFIGGIQRGLLKLITAISRRGKEVKYGAPIAKNMAKELLQTLIMAYTYCARFSLLRVQVRNMLSFVVNGNFIVMPYMKKDEALALIQQEKKPHDGPGAMRLSIMRLPVQLHHDQPTIPMIDESVFPFATWLMKGFERSSE